MCTTAECIATLQENIVHIQNEYGVRGLCIFGSVARGDNKSDSDVDILVDMPPKIFLLCALKEYLEKILHTSVDLIRRHSHLSPKFLKAISQDVITIL